MSVYAIFLEKSDSEVWDALKSKWGPRFFVLNDVLAFVAPEEPITTTSEIAAAAGIGGETGRVGLVIEHAAQTGFHRDDLWEWLRKVR